MSLRRFYKLIALLLLFIMATFLVLHYWKERKPEQKVSSNFRAMTEIAEPHRGIVLSVDGNFIEYALPASANMVRIMSNANLKSIDTLRSQRRVNPARRWQYALEIEELSSGGEVIRRREHHFRRDLVESEMPGGGQGTGSFYIRENAPAPLPAANLRLDFAGAAYPARLRIRLLSADPDIADVLVRVAVPTPLSQRSAEIAWKRLNDQQQQKLASGNVFPPELLIEQERNNLLASRWLPISPAGDVEERDIYVLRNDDLGAAIEPVTPPALLAGPGHLVTAQLPEKGGKVRIVLEAINDLEEFPAKVTVRWAGHSAFQRRSSTHLWNSGRFEMRSEFKGGWLEMNASRAASVHIWINENGVEKDITPPVQYFRTWPAQDQAPVEFVINHAGNVPTPIRLVLRGIGSDGKSPINLPARVDLIGEDGGVIHTIPLSMQANVSQYDALWPLNQGSSLSDPVDAFFKIPVNAQRMRITSADPVLVNAYSRPSDLARVIRTPEDTTTPEASETAIPAWFPLQPVDHEARILNGATRLLTIQERLPEDRPDLTSGRYQWEDFNPVNKGAARVFLAPREEGVPDRMSAVSSTYRPISVNGYVHFIAEPGRTGVAPRLAWTSDRPRSFRYVLFIDGQQWTTGAASGIAGEVAVPSLQPGRHHIRIESDTNLGWYANHVAKGDSWVKRSAYRFDKALSFEVERTSLDEEFVAVRLFRPAGAASRMKVKVQITAPNAKQSIGPFPGWLFTERVHDVRPSGEFALPIAETDGEKTDAGQAFYIPFPKAAPRGNYRITLTPQGSGWVTVSRITAGLSAMPKLILESNGNAE